MTAQLEEAKNGTNGESNATYSFRKLTEPNCSDATSDKQNNEVLIAADGTMKKIN